MEQLKWHVLRTALVLAGVSIVVFTAINLAPGDTAQVLLGTNATPERLEALRQDLGLDRPIYVQYWSWLRSAITGDLGYSFSLKDDVLTILWDRLGNSLILALPALVLSTLLGVALGTFAGLRKDSMRDSAVNLFTFVSLATPPFWLGLMAVWLFAYKAGWFPPSGMHTSIVDTHVGDLMRHAVLPVVTLAIAPAAVVAQVTRTSVAEEITQPYMQTARAKGCSRRRAEVVHALRNSLMAIGTVMSLNIIYVVGGAVLVETVFNWPGIGDLLVDATVSRDYALVMGAAMVVAVSVVLSNLVIDLVYPLIDPRVRVHA